jgi:8-oxo-dGTP diphosphatase
MKEVPFIIFKRRGFDNLRSDIRIEDVVDNISDISSTDIRERLANGESITGMVPGIVEDYIIENELYKSRIHYDNPASTATLIVPIEDGIAFVKRKHPPYKGQWALPGGYLETGKEDLLHAAVRELFEETSLRAKPRDLKLLEVNSSPTRDPRGHVIDHVYIVEKFTGELFANDDAEKVKVFSQKPRNLAFDHSKVYDDYIKRSGLK